jgi:MORN repeat variant
MNRMRVLVPALWIAGVLATGSLAPSCGGPAMERDTADTTGTALRADSIRKATIADSLRDGYHVYKSADGRPLMEGTMQGGKRVGVWTSYLPSGRVQSRNVFSDGVPHGITTVFHDNGVLYYSGDQRMGKPFGEWKFYDREGNLSRTVVYDTSGTMVPDKSRPLERPVDKHGSTAPK